MPNNIFAVHLALPNGIKTELHHFLFQENRKKQQQPWVHQETKLSLKNPPSRLLCTAHLSDKPDDWPRCRGDQKVGNRIAMIVLPYQDPLTLGGHIGTSKNQEESENRYWLSNLQHLQQTPSSFQSNIRLSLLYPLNIPKMHLIYHYPYFNLNCYHLCSGSERQTLHCFSAV